MTEPGSSRWKRIFRIIRPILVVALFFLALTALRDLVRDYKWHDLVDYLHRLPESRFMMGTLFAAAGYFVMTCYDTFAFRYYIRHALPYSSIALAAFSAYAINNNLGMSGVVGTSLRYRFYSQWGVRGSQIAIVFVFCTLTYWLGFVILGGLLFVLHAPAIPASAHLPFASIRLFGLALLIPALGYLGWVLLRRKPLRFRGYEFPMPNVAIFAVQVILSSLDWMLAGAVLYALLPADNTIPYLTVLGVFFLAQIAGLISNVPGGLGVFETIAVMLLKPFIPAAQILGAVVTFRGIYFLLPLIVAILLLGVHFLRRRKTQPE